MAAGSGLGGVRVLGYGQQGPSQAAVQALGQQVAGFGPQRPMPQAGGQQAASTAGAVVAELMLDRRASQLFLQSIDGWLQGGAQQPYQPPLPLPPQQAQQLQQRLAALAQQGSPYLAIPDLQTATAPRLLPGAGVVTETPSRDQLTKQLLSRTLMARAQQGFGKGSASLTPPKAVQAACRRGLELAGEHGGDGLTAGALGRARQMAAGKPVSLPTVKRIKAFHSRHASYDKQANPPSPGYVAQQLWGGAAGQSWAEAHADAEPDSEPTQKAQAKWRRQGWVGPGGAWATAKRKARAAGKDDAYASAIYRKMTGKSMSALHLLQGHLAKADSGPGSRGGRVIGTTRSGRPIYASGTAHPSAAGYTKKDHEDAAQAHQKLSQKMGDEHHDHAYDHRMAAGVRNHSKVAQPETKEHFVYTPKPMRGATNKSNSGPGSRGGHVIGTTASGKAIYAATHEKYHSTHAAIEADGAHADVDHDAAHAVTQAHPSYGRQEHMEAAEAHQFAAARAHRSDPARAASHRASEAHALAAMSQGFAKKSSRNATTEKPMSQTALEFLRTHMSKAGGAGSRGGTILRYTKGGDPVYANHAASHDAYSGFSRADHDTAMNAHSKTAKKWQQNADHYAQRELDGEGDHSDYKKKAEYSQAKADHHSAMAESHAAIAANG